MPAGFEKCPECGHQIDYWRPHCSRCGHLIGYPNRRTAEAERNQLWDRYKAAREDAERRGIRPLLDKLEDLAGRSLPVIGMDFRACDDILRADKYRNYHQRVASGERDPASEQDHADRVMVGERLFPMYGQHIAYAALSPDGRGLQNYGPVAVRWQVTPTYLGRRASLLEENSFIFYDSHHLGDRGAKCRRGIGQYGTTVRNWLPRSSRRVLTPRQARTTYPSFSCSRAARARRTNSSKIFIYAEEGLDTQDVDMVTFQRAAKDNKELKASELIREICAERGIELVE